MAHLARASLAAAALLLGATACSASEAVNQVDKAVDEAYEVTYEVTGKGVDSIEFAAGGGTATEPEPETVSAPALPWTRTVTLRGIMPASVMPLSADVVGGQVTCKILHKGKVIAEQSGEGLATAGGCVAVSPVVG